MKKYPLNTVLEICFNILCLPDIEYVSIWERYSENTAAFESDFAEFRAA